MNSYETCCCTVCTTLDCNYYTAACAGLHSTVHRVIVICTESKDKGKGITLISRHSCTAVVLNAAHWSIGLSLCFMVAGVPLMLPHWRCVTDRAGVQPTPQSKPAPTDFDLQPYAALVCCRLMVSTPIIHVITWITTHLPILEGWKAELA